MVVRVNGSQTDRGTAHEKRVAFAPTLGWLLRCDFEPTTLRLTVCRFQTLKKATDSESVVRLGREGICQTNQKG